MIDEGLIVIVGCGAQKLEHPAPAAELYTGPYFRSCLSAARALVPDERVYILSALHGLLPVTGPELVAGYNVLMGDVGSVTAAEVRAQAQQLWLLRCRVLALCSARYADVCREVWADVSAPLAGLGLFSQRHVLAEMRDTAAST